MASNYCFKIKQEQDSRLEQLCSWIPHHVFIIGLAFQYVSPQGTTLESFHRSLICRRDWFLSQEYGPKVVSLMLANTGASPDFHRTAIDDILSFAWEINTDPFNLRRQTITLLVELLVQATDDDGSLAALNFKPASRSFIQSLKRVKLGEDEAFLPLKKRGRIEGLSSRKQWECSICLDEVLEGEEVASMPCGHVYHSHCIVRWLETSHLCPLCRHQMPC
ncbi:hypothetical protein Gotri_005340 [Gossypium trilobum]|uniref:RING-type E3 ubiquitin transferase n=1 Tax=Gossypium trilobum TaxID=34281 RepID=A0A7J9EW78_9ROSI|nr:hypothetical protein [Gossypium trilobum]